jgi:hypothetical protein
MRMLVIFVLSVLIVGCSDESPDIKKGNATKAEDYKNALSDEEKKELKYEKWSNAIDEQFWPFSLQEYEFQKEEANVVYGLGGRWISVRYLLREGNDITREEIRQRIIRSFEFYEWKRTDLPKVKYVLSTIYETSEDDLCFTRNSFTSNDTTDYYKITIYISDDASVLVLYCEAAW